MLKQNKLRRISAAGGLGHGQGREAAPHLTDSELPIHFFANAKGASRVMVPAYAMSRIFSRRSTSLEIKLCWRGNQSKGQTEAYLLVLSKAAKRLDKT